MSSLTDILLRPDAFFRDIMKEDESLKFPLIILLICAVAGSAAGFVIAGPTMTMTAAIIPPEMAGMYGIIGIIGILLTLIIQTLVVWVVLSGIFYVISSLFKGTGSFRRCLQVTGYGYLPSVLGSLISLIVALQYIPRVVVPMVSSSAIRQDPQIFQDALKTLMHDPAMMELTQITTLVSIVFLLLSAHIWIFGMKHARGLSPRDAAICVGVPVVLYVLYLTYNLGVM